MLNQPWAASHGKELDVYVRYARLELSFVLSFGESFKHKPFQRCESRKSESQFPSHRHCCRMHEVLRNNGQQQTARRPASTAVHDINSFQQTFN